MGTSGCWVWIQYSCSVRFSVDREECVPDCYDEVILALTMRRIGTLLNRLFGTTFDVMDETKRQQTTKGMSDVYPSYAQIYCLNYRNLDVSRERYECYGHGCRGYGRA